MPYIAFLDLVGTKSSALTSNLEYKEAITDFNTTLKMLSDNYNQCQIYGYSDNAYIQFENLKDIISFLEALRKNLLLRHRYFSAAVDVGNLKPALVSFRNPKKKVSGTSIMFTETCTIGIYLAQCNFSGIGFNLSKQVVEELKEMEMDKYFRYSVYQTSYDKNICKNLCPVIDIAYNLVTKDDLSLIISDCIATAILNKRAARYYITPIITMIKCLNLKELIDDTNSIIELITFQRFPKALNQEIDQTYSLFFLCALIDYSLSIDNPHIDTNGLCTKIVQNNCISTSLIVENISSVPVEIISKKNKMELIKILFETENNLKSQE